MKITADRIEHLSVNGTHAGIVPSAPIPSMIYTANTMGCRMSDAEKTKSPYPFKEIALSVRKENRIYDITYQAPQSDSVRLRKNVIAEQ